MVATKHWNATNKATSGSAMPMCGIALPLAKIPIRSATIPLAHVRLYEMNIHSSLILLINTLFLPNSFLVTIRSKFNHLPVAPCDKFALGRHSNA